MKRTAARTPCPHHRASSRLQDGRRRNHSLTNPQFLLNPALRQFRVFRLPHSQRAQVPARQQAYSATIIRNSIRFQRSTEFPSCRNSTSRPRKSASSSPASFAPASAPNNHRASQQVRGSSSIPTGMPRTTRQNTPRQPLSGNSTTGFQSTAKAVLPTESDIWGGSFSRFSLL